MKRDNPDIAVTQQQKVRVCVFVYVCARPLVYSSKRSVRFTVGPECSKMMPNLPAWASVFAFYLSEPNHVTVLRFVQPAYTPTGSR